VKYLEAIQAKALLRGVRHYKGQLFAGFTGTMAAALGANSTVFAVRYPAAATGLLVVQWMHLHFTCLASFTTPVTAGRRLSLRRGSGGNPSTGTDIDSILALTSDVNDPVGQTLLTGQVATTGALTMTGVTYDTGTLARMMLSHVGSSGLDHDELWKSYDPLAFLRPGELLGIVAPAAFDAAGTWQLSVKGRAFEIAGV
jgi:hypothetical protein